MMSLDAKILVVDDEASIRYFLTETLTDAGYQVVSVDSGEAALSASMSQTFDLALLDLRLPGISGIETLQAMREWSPDTTVIVLTAHASLDTAVEALRHGAHDYLFKPCEPAQLRESVRTGLLKRQRELRQQLVLARLEDSLHNNFEDILVAAIGQVMTSPVTADRFSDKSSNLLCQGSVCVDLAQHTITVKGRPVEFSPMEFDLFVYLLRESPRVISPQELAHKVLGYVGEPWGVSDLMRTHIYRMRQKLKHTVTGEKSLVRTVRGVGYTLDV
ncbi:MAG: response regulator transcription factor [Anaerolineae bacterium]|nr:response regulator transcription factor [Anaerolineae bacterium]